MKRGYMETPMDFCNLCESYDTIQTYFIFKEGKKQILFHICEKCLRKYETETEIVKAYINKRKEIVG